MWRDWDVTIAIRLLILHAFVYLTERQEFVTIVRVASRHRWGMNRCSRNGKASFRKIRTFIALSFSMCYGPLDPRKHQDGFAIPAPKGCFFLCLTGRKLSLGR